MARDLLDRGFIFWPVGCGDSTTIKDNDNVVLQVDLRHTAKSEDDDGSTSRSSTRETPSPATRETSRR